MRKILFVFFFLLAPTVEAQDKFKPYSFLWLESQTAMNGRDMRIKNPSILETVNTLTYGKQATEAVGVVVSLSHANFDLSESWSEATLTWSVANRHGISLGIGPGIENNGGDNLNPRFRANIFVDDEETNSFFYAQYDAGRGTSWYWIDGMYFPFKSVGFGLLVQMPDLGAGPKAEVRLGKHLSVWGAGVTGSDSDIRYGVFGLRLKADW